MSSITLSLSTKQKKQSLINNYKTARGKKLKLGHIAGQFESRTEAKQEIVIYQTKNPRKVVFF